MRPAPPGEGLTGQAGSRCEPSKLHTQLMLSPAPFNSSHTTIHYKTPISQKDGLKNKTKTKKRTVLNRAVALICNYRHQNDQNNPKACDIFIVLCSFNHALSYISEISIVGSSPGILLIPTQNSFCLVQIKEERERPGSTAAAAQAWIQEEYLGTKIFSRASINSCTWTGVCPPSCRPSAGPAACGTRVGCLSGAA